MVASPNRDPGREISPIIPFAPRQWIAPLPASLTPLVGRGREITSAAELLRGQVRLLTLTGPGGIGKTRLALAIAAELADDFADGIVWVPLASVDDPGGVMPAIARALGVLEGGDQPPIERVKTAVRGAELLLLLDNFEQVVAAAPQLAELLLTSPGLRMLVSSRARLRVIGEHAWPVPPLDVGRRVGETEGRRERAQFPADPPTRRPSDWPEAVQLFADCAVAANPLFRLDDASLPVAVEICRRLDGLPLAIELAAARVTHLALPALLERLEHRLPLLTTGGPDRPQRHRTMRDAIAWSYDLLTGAEQALFRRLSVFSGGFTLEAAERVAERAETAEGAEERREGEEARRREVGADASSVPPPSPPPAPPQTLELLGSLVEHTLVRLDSSAQGGPRYTALETVREFAAEQLAAAGEDVATRDAHAAYFLDVAEGFAAVQYSANDPAVTLRMEAEHANVRAAIGHIGQRGPIEDFVRIAAALGYYWFMYGHSLEARAWVERAWENSDAMPVSTRVNLARALGFMRLGRGLPDEAEACVNAGLALARATQDARGTALMLTMLGVVNASRGRYETAIPCFEEALAVTDRIDDRRESLRLTSGAHANLGVALRGLGRLDEAGAHYRLGLEGHRAAGYIRGEMDSLVDLGDLGLDTGDLAEAWVRYRASLVLAWAQGERRALFGSLAGLACVASGRGRAEEAARWFGAAERLSEITGIGIWTPADQASVARGIAQARTALGEEAFTAAWKVGREQPLAQTVTEAMAMDGSDAGSVPLSAPEPTLEKPVTARERQILQMVVAGRTDREIADELFLSVRTVEAHVGRILNKLGVRSRTAAAGAAIAAGLVVSDAAPEDGPIP